MTDYESPERSRAIRKERKQLMADFQSLSNQELKDRLDFEIEKAKIEEEVRGDIPGATTSSTNWIINALNSIKEQRGL